MTPRTSSRGCGCGRSAKEFGHRSPDIKSALLPSAPGDRCAARTALARWFGSRTSSWRGHAGDLPSRCLACSAGSLTVVLANLTPTQLAVLNLYRINQSAKQIGTALGFSRQRADEIIEALRRKVLTTDPSEWATTRELHPPDSRTQPWPPPARRARQGEFVMRAVVLPREDGTDLPYVPDECSITWTWYGVASRRLGWSWAASRTCPWSIEDTLTAYADWRTWMDAAQRAPYIMPAERIVLPELGTQACYDPGELTRTLAWVIGVEGLIYPAGG
jgi:hypothetical protein